MNRRNWAPLIRSFAVQLFHFLTLRQQLNGTSYSQAKWNRVKGGESLINTGADPRWAKLPVKIRIFNTLSARRPLQLQDCSLATSDWQIRMTCLSTGALGCITISPTCWNAHSEEVLGQYFFWGFEGRYQKEPRFVLVGKLALMACLSACIGPMSTFRLPLVLRSPRFCLWPMTPWNKLTFAQLARGRKEKWGEGGGDN